MGKDLISNKMYFNVKCMFNASEIVSWCLEIVI